MDVDFLRDLLLYLEHRQVSPRSTVIIDTREGAEQLGRDAFSIYDGLNLLQDLDYIEGPGAETGGLWFFRKLTHKGTLFVTQARDPAAWEKIKERHQFVKMTRTSF